MKWEFYSVAAEEMMTFADNEEFAIQERQMYAKSHVPIPIPKDSALKGSTYMICYMEEGVQSNAFDNKRKRQGNTHGEHHILPFARTRIAT